MGTDINSINMWIPLTECGGETGAPAWMSFRSASIRLRLPMELPLAGL